MYLKKWYNGADHEFFQATHETMSLFVSGLLYEFVTDMFAIFSRNILLRVVYTVSLTCSVLYILFCLQKYIGFLFF